MDKKNTDLNNKEINYWRGFAELNNDPKFIEVSNSEFENYNPDVPGFINKKAISRRKFLALLSALAAFAAASCTNYRNKGEIVPYNKKPEEITIGNPVYYSSTCNACQYSCGIIIKTREGRPIKIDGNPDHPVSKGKICARGQANILNLYDPERLKEPQYSEDGKYYSKMQWADADDKIIKQLKSISTSGKEIAIISHSVTSPTLKKLFDDFVSAYLGTKIYSYELYNDLNYTSAFKKTYNTDSVPVIKWESAKVILSLESDFLVTDGNKVEQVRLYTQNREIIGKQNFNKLYTVEGGVSLTGLNSDYRIKLRTDAIEEFVLSLLNEFIVRKKISKYSPDTSVVNILNSYPLNDFIKKYNLESKIIKELVSDLTENQGASIITSGFKLPESTHIAVNLLNEVLGNSKLFSENNFREDLIPLSSKKDIDSLVSNIGSGKVGAVINFDSNPAFHFSDDYKYDEIIKKVPLAITLSESISETAYLSHYILPVNHTLESWGDFKTRGGFYSFQQPVINPLYNTRQKEAILLNWITGNKDSYNDAIYLNYLKDNWEKKIFPTFNLLSSFKEFWYAALHDGVVSSNEKLSKQYNFEIKSFTSSLSAGTFKSSKNFIVVLSNNHFIGDGKFANNGWLQEIPHPVSKIVWDNYAAISPSSAKELGLNSDDKIEISAGGKSLSIPIFIQPGLADKVITIELGYGRTKVGKVGENVGVDASKLIAKNPVISDYIYTDVKITKLADKYKLVSTQEHYPIDNERYKDIQFKRHIIQEGTLNGFIKNKDFLHKEKKSEDLSSINSEHEYSGVKWAMAIDLNKCTGCAECIVSCNVENNIPVVGKEQVDKGREMYWIRIDRYYSGNPDDPKASFQPMLCQQCDFAPCENVCPVSATTHTIDGLNGMTYNRCVGTRYCSNNCPYKVRRFNFFNFRDHFADGYYLGESLSLSYNPEVTVRSRGVMEKCTFCLQRIMKARQDATVENRELKGSDVKTACQEACPANAIQFGDMSDKDSELNIFRNHKLGYNVLEEIKVKPNVTYIAKLRNITDEKSEG
jgi:molybdopterin-containing oxidoreductase family iron-sulfur binding subunit